MKLEKGKQMSVAECNAFNRAQLDKAAGKKPAPAKKPAAKPAAEKKAEE